jgi:hypothetical protein
VDTVRKGRRKVTEAITLDDAETTAKPLTKRLVAFAKDKGGTGTSFIARLVGEQHAKRGTGALLMDGDGTTASLSKHFGLPRENPDEPSATNAANPVHTFALHGKERDRDKIASLLEADASTIVLDLPATALTVLRKIEAEAGWVGMIREHGFRPTIVASITPFEESIFDLRDAMELFGTDADYIAVVNIGTAEERDDFTLWDTGTTRKRLLAAGGFEVEFPRLKPRIAAALSKYKLTFEAGRTSEHLELMDRSRLAKWISLAETAIAPVADKLGL